jgi:hypothetical protein
MTFLILILIALLIVSLIAMAVREFRIRRRAYDEEEWEYGEGWESAISVLTRLAADHGLDLDREGGRHRREGRHRIETRKGIDMTHCRGCGADILVVPMISNKDQKLALDASPHPKGTVIVTGGVCRYLDGAKDYNVVREYGLPVYRRHNLHCPRVYPRHPSMEEHI